MEGWLAVAGWGAPPASPALLLAPGPGKGLGRPPPAPPPPAQARRFPHHASAARADKACTQSVHSVLSTARRTFRDSHKVAALVGAGGAHAHKRCGRGAGSGGRWNC